VKICDLPGGWSIHHEYDDPEIGPLPLLVHKRYGRRTNLYFMAHRPEGREVFKAVKQWLDEADRRLQYGSQANGAWRAMDKAKFAIEDALREVGRWDDSLLENPVALSFEES
jgi:hypothetical protein